MNVVIDAATLGTDHLEGFDLATGMRFGHDTLERMLCDCDLHRMITAGSEVLDYGRAARTPPPGLWNALVARDQHPAIIRLLTARGGPNDYIQMGPTSSPIRVAERA